MGDEDMRMDVRSNLLVSLRSWARDQMKINKTTKSRRRSHKAVKTNGNGG